MISSLERLRRRVRGQIRDWIQDAASAVARRWRQLPLRTRLTTFAAAAVAVAVIAVSVAAILVIREQLLGQFNRDLLDQARYVARHMAETVPDTRSRISGDVPLLQVLRVDGTVARPENQATTLPVSGRDLDVVAGGSDVEYSDVRVDGVRYRMVTIDAPGGALQFARQPIEVEDRLAQYTLLLVVIGAVGVVSAAMLGMTVARAGLAPVDRLTAAAEHVAATQDLRAAITVTGDDEVARLGRAFNAMLAALESSREDQRRLIDDASHELRTPLTSLRTNIELLLRAEEQAGSGRSLPAADRARLLRDLDAQMAELTQLTSELVELARNDAGTEPEEELDLADVVVAAVERARVRTPGVRIETTFESAPVTGRRSSLERAVLNMLDNASKWTPAEAPILVRLGRRTIGGREWAVLEVEDHGPGIADEDLPRIFERFYRSASARSMSGSGLGLAILHQAVTAHGGTVTAERAPSGGALFRVLLPCSAESGQIGEPGFPAQPGPEGLPPRAPTPQLRT